MYGIDDWLEAAYDDRDTAEDSQYVDESAVDEDLCPICEVPIDLDVHPRGPGWCANFDRIREQ